MILGEAFFRLLLHIPDSRPTEKQLQSLLKETDKTAVGLDDSIGGRTFMVTWDGSESLEGCEQRQMDEHRDVRQARC